MGFGKRTLLGEIPNFMFGHSAIQFLANCHESLKQCMWISQCDGSTSCRKISSNNVNNGPRLKGQFAKYVVQSYSKRKSTTNIYDNLLNELTHILLCSLRQTTPNAIGKHRYNDILKLVEDLSRGLYYRILRICNLKKMDRFCNQLMSFL